jgi:DNA-binding transcriptional LysR family regulator
MPDLTPRASRLKLRDLQCFVTVAETGNMARAAVELGTAQSSVSNSIAALEEVAAMPLFNRLAHGVELTERGRLLLPHIKGIFGDLNAAFDNPAEDPQTGIVRIGASPALMGVLIAPAVISFCRRHPQITVLVTDGTANDLPGLVIDRELDLCVCRRSDALQHDSLETLDLMNTEISVYAGRAHPLSSQDTVSILDILPAKWCLPSAQHPHTEILNAMFIANDLPPPVATIVTTNAYVAWEAINSGEYLVIMASGLLGFLPIIKEFTIREESARMTTRVSALVTLKGRPLSSAAKKFATHLTAYAQGLKQAAEEIPNIVL